MSKHIAGSDWRARSDGVTEQRMCMRLGEWVRPQRDVPVWHWRYWFGYRWRIDVRFDYVTGISGSSPVWEYQTDKQRAMEVLEEQYGDREPQDTQSPITLS